MSYFKAPSLSCAFRGEDEHFATYFKKIMKKRENENVPNIKLITNKSGEKSLRKQWDKFFKELNYLKPQYDTRGFSDYVIFMA